MGKVCGYTRLNTVENQKEPHLQTLQIHTNSSFSFVEASSLYLSGLPQILKLLICAYEPGRASAHYCYQCWEQILLPVKFQWEQVCAANTLILCMAFSVTWRSTVYTLPESCVPWFNYNCQPTVHFIKLPGNLFWAVKQCEVWLMELSFVDVATREVFNRMCQHLYFLRLVD